MSRAEDVPGPLTLAEASPTFRRDPGTSDQLDVLCVRRCLDGRAEAFEEIVARYQKPMFNLIYQMVHDYEDAREITQTAFLKAFSSLKRFDQERRFFSWLCRIAMNESINALASRKPSEPILSDFASAAASPEDRASAAEVRAVITLRHIANCSYREASEILGIPEKTVKSRLFSARQLLREELRARGFGGGA
jgi:RNA polymerase sigma-70 factor (ECF subfamily)